MTQLLSIETGFGCNNRCRFCYQDDLRAGVLPPPDLSTEELLAKLRYGAANGFDEAGFSGGEPTIRPDLPELVAAARQLGYHHVSLTTNGRRLADRNYAATLVAAGVTSVGVSVHAADARIHDALTCIPGSFAQSAAGIENLVGLGRQQGLHLDLNLFTLICRPNAQAVSDVIRTFAARGLALFILQPLIYGRGTLAQAHELALPPAELFSVVRRCAATARACGVRLRLYNLPRCCLPDDQAVLDPSRSGRPRIFREHEKDHPGQFTQAPPTPIPRRGGQLPPNVEPDRLGPLPAAARDDSLETPPNFFRLRSCAGCTVRSQCPGLHATLLPQSVIVEQIADAIATRDPVADGRTLWLAGLELAEVPTLLAVRQAAAQHGYRRVILHHGGISILGLQFYTAVAQAGFETVRFVLHRAHPQSNDRRIVLGGNSRHVLEGLQQLRSLAMSVQRECVVVLDTGPVSALPQLFGSLAQAGAQTLWLHFSQIDLAPQSQIVQAIRPLLAPSVRRFRPGLQVRLATSRRISDYPRWMRYLTAACLSIEPWSGQLLASPFVGPRYSWVTWSIPHSATARPPNHVADSGDDPRKTAPIVVADRWFPMLRPILETEAP